MGAVHWVTYLVPVQVPYATEPTVPVAFAPVFSKLVPETAELHVG
jgi:hypothetical protein